MKRGMLVRVCALAVLFGLLVSSVFTQSVAGASTGYEVGYAKVDVNPWVDLKLPDGTTIGISASDPSISASDAAKYIVETEIADPANTSKTMKQKIVAVPLGGYGNAPDRLATSMMDDNGDGKAGYGDGMISSCTTVTDAYGKTVVYVTLDCIRAGSSMTNDIRNAVVAAIGSANISADQIMVSASHSHSAPDYGYASQNTVWKAYYDYAIARIASAAKEAFDTKSAAEMTKGSIEAPAGMKARGYGDGVSLNFVRHAIADATLIKRDYMYGYKYSDVTYTATTVRTAHSGGAFKQSSPGSNYTGTWYQSNITLKQNVSEADETLHVLQFTREEGDPVLLVNWRAHAAMNGGGSDLRISSDYVGSLRYNLEQAGYCVGFWQGAAGNINGGNMANHANDALPTPWEDINIGGLDRAAKYGYLLAEVTLACLDSNMVDCEEGAIRNRQEWYQARRYEESAEMIAAVKQWQIDEAAGSVTYPYVYTIGSAKYVINSWYHAQQIISRETRTGTIPMELNVMTLGKDVALVTVPVEAFDRYSNDATLSNTTDNDWDDLIGDVYGTPFVLGYSNGHEGYLPNKLAYEFNDFKPGDPYYGIYGKGSYESDTTKMAQGEGEAMIAELGGMFEILASGYKTERCDVCDQEAAWFPLTQGQIGRDLENGHYYLAENITTESIVSNSNIGSAATVEKVCLDLNGKTLDHKGQVFEVYNGSTLNIMDSGTDGKIIARTGGDVQGGLVLVNSGATLNLYGGTLQFIKDESYTGNPVGRGGVICSSGHVYMYGGAIVGGEVSIVKSSVLPSYNGVGGAVYLSGGTGRFHMSGGHIQAYTGTTADGVVGNCVYVQGTYGVTDKDSGGGFYLSGDAVVDEIYIEEHRYSSYRNVSFSGKYTGSAGFRFAPSVTLEGETFVANVRDNADISSAYLHCLNDESSKFRIVNGRVYMTKGEYAAIIDETKYKTLADAIADYTGGTIKLLCNTESVTLNKTVDLLDLNGCVIKNVTVNEGFTLTCMDSQTDDFTITDGFGYGVIKSFTGNVTTIPVEENGYLMLGDDENGDGVADTDVSFHRVDLSLTAISLRPQSEGNASNPGIYYKSNFAGDEVVKQKVKFFGVALSLDKEPNADNMDTTSEYSSFGSANFQAGNNTAASTLLTNIMQADADNETRATMPIYGRAYIQLYGGVYVFGSSRSMTLKALTESVSDQWNACTTKQKEAVLAMYGTYQSIMKNWNVPNIVDAFAES